MKRMTTIAMMAVCVGLGVAPQPVAAQDAKQDGKGKTCRMEQQCRWENFKKICVYVKVCR